MDTVEGLDRRQIVVSVVLSVAMTIGWLAVLPHVQRTGGDTIEYLRMAADPKALGHLLLVAAGLARETVAGLALPIYMWLRTRWLDLNVGWHVVLLVSPALLATWAIRQPMRTYGWPTTWTLIEAGAKIMYHQRLAANPLWWLCYAFAGSLSIWWLLGLYGRRHGGRLWTPGDQRHAAIHVRSHTADGAHRRDTLVATPDNDGHLKQL